jgi:hypothetical protein
MSTITSNNKTQIIRNNESIYMNILLTKFRLYHVSSVESITVLVYL